MRLLLPLYRADARSDGSLPLSNIKKRLNRIQINDQAMSSEEYLPGGGGESKLYHDLVDQAGLEDFVGRRA